MSANMYDVGVPVPIMDTYVPINFDALYKIGAAQKEEVEKAATQLTTALQKFGEFHSPSDIDTQNWYNLTLNNPVIGGLIEEASRNPDVLKDGDWRSRFNAGIMGIDYGALSRLKAGKENMLARQKVNQELMMKDMYNPLLHDVDFANYNTLQDGIFNDVSPLGYQSVVDMVKPYVDNLKGRYLGTKNGMIFNGVDDTDTDAQLNKNWSSIITSPHYAQNLQLIKMQNPGISDEDAVNALNEQIFTAGREFTWNKTERDPMALAKYKHDLDNGDRSNRGLLNLTEQVRRSALGRFDSFFSDIPIKEDDPSFGRKGAQSKLNKMFNDDLKRTGNVKSAINHIALSLSTDVDPVGSNIFTGAGTDADNPAPDGYKMGISSDYFIPRRQLIDNMRGVKRISGNKLYDDLVDGNYQDFLVKGDNKAISDGSNIYHSKYIYIPEKEVKKRYFNGLSKGEAAGMLHGWMDELAADFVDIGENNVRVSKSTNAYNETTTTQSVNNVKQKYIRIPVYSVIPLEGQPRSANDGRYWQSLGTGTEMNTVQQARSQASSFGNEEEEE